MSGSTLARTVLLLVAALAALPALADFRLEREFEVGPGGRFELDSAVGSVVLTGSRDSGIHVLITSNRDDIEDYVELDLSQDGDTVRVVGEKIRRLGSPLWSLFGGSRGRTLRFEVRVPRETEIWIEVGGGAVEVSGIRGSVEASTSGGGVQISDIAGPVRAHTSGGAIELRDVEGDSRVSTSGGGIRAESIGGSLEAKTSGGPITIARVSGDVLAKTSGGGIRIDGAGGRIEASTSGGPVTARFDRLDFPGGSLSSSGGGIRVSVPASASLELDASTSGGSVTCDLPITIQGKIERSSLRGTIGGGGELLRIRTSGGSIRISEH